MSRKTRDLDDLQSVPKTSRVRNKETLLTTGVLQNAIFNSATFSCIATDVNGLIQIFNVGAERMLGYTSAEVLNKVTLVDLHVPEEMADRARRLSTELGIEIEPGFEALVFKASRGMEDIYECTKVRKDGTRYPAVISVTALRDREDAIIGYLMTGIDNTELRELGREHKHAEDALQKSEERFRAFVTSRWDVVYRMNPDWTEMHQLHGRNVLVDTPTSTRDWLDEYIYPSDQPLVMSVIDEAIRTKNDFDLEHRIRMANGTLGWTHSRAIPICDEKGEVTEWFGAATDVTERKRTEEALRESEARFHTIVENLSEGLVVADLDGNVLNFNRAALDLYGFSSMEEYLGNTSKFASMFEISGIDGEVWPMSEWPLARVLRGEKVRSLEARIRRIPDGWERYFSYGGALVDDSSGNPMLAILIISDITERKLFDLQRREANVKLEAAKSAAEKANLAKSEFLSSMSHELRSPLNAILGFAQLMESATPPPTPSQGKSIAHILQAGWYLLKLINEVLDLTVIEAGKISLSTEVVSLSELMSECQSMMEPQAQERGIKLRFPPSEQAIFVTADRTRLMQIVINLISNAIKYNKHNGNVIVTYSESADGRLRFSVTDEGVGIPPDKLAQLFTPFNRLGQESGGVAGTGIGLVVSKRLAELMGGSLGAESKVGIGSVFWCELPLAQAPEASVDHDDELFGTGVAQVIESRRTLLYVEDNPANMQLVEDLVGRFPDLRLITATNGAVGIELARTAHPQVILMDINLPGINGVKALKILREDPATAHIPVIALSANAMPRDIRKGMEAGFFRYLTKPIKIKELMDTLAAAIQVAERRLARAA